MNLENTKYALTKICDIISHLTDKDSYVLHGKIGRENVFVNVPSDVILEDLKKQKSKMEYLINRYKED